MTLNKALITSVFICTVFLFNADAQSQSDCETVKSIEDLNKGILDRRVVHIKGENARIFVALDPIWSMPEFHDVPYRHEEDMIRVKKDFKQLMEQGIDEVIVWGAKRPEGLGLALAFKEGCLVKGYGEPDYLSKLIPMHETYLLITKYSLDHPSVRDSIEKTLINSRYGKHLPHDNKIDAIINNIRPLIKSIESSPSR